MNDATAMNVLRNNAAWSVQQADVLEFLASLPADSVDLVFGSPPYTAARTYFENGKDLGISRAAEQWTAWMVDVTVAALRVCRGLVAWVIEGQTSDYRWDAAPLLLGADLVRRGICLRRPCYYRRSGIPGSGGPDWFRCDAEIVLCCTRGGKLPWADVTACGHPPKWAPGGEMRYRLANGARVNQWGRSINVRGDGTRNNKDVYDDARRPSHVAHTGDTTGQLTLDGLPAEAERPYVNPLVNKGGYTRKQDGTAKSNHGTRKNGKASTSRRQGSDERKDEVYLPPVLANPGNVIQQTYTSQQIDDMLGNVGEYVDCQVGGGQMGSNKAHQNEAPFPEPLAERFVRSFCPPDGIVCDPFSGSGTTLAVAIRWGRRAVCCDLRQSQVDLSRRRAMEETPPLPGIPLSSEETPS